MSGRMTPAREPILNVPAVVVAVIALLCAIHGVREYVLTADADRELLLRFAFIPARYEASAFIDGVLPGGVGAKVWTFVTYGLLHADLTHLGVNSIWLLAFGSPLSRRFGTLRFCVFLLVTTAAGALAHLIAHPGQLAPVIGASAAVSGAMGAAARFVFQPGGPLDGWHPDAERTAFVPAASLREAFRNRRVIIFLAVWFGLNLLFGVGSLSLTGDDQIIAWEAHVGGFLAGLLLFGAFDPHGSPAIGQEP